MRQLVNYSKEQVNKIHELIEKPAVDFVAEDFHQLRVGIKKIRAIFGLPWANTPHHYLEQLKYLFRAAGPVREIQLELDHLQRSSPKNTRMLRTMLLKELNFHKEQFFRLKDQLIGQAPMGDLQLEKSVGGIKKRKLKAHLFEASRKLTGKAGAKSLNSKQLHGLRKGIKKLYFIQKAAGLDTHKNPLLQTADTLSEQLGKWHDLRVLSRQLKTALHIERLGKMERNSIVSLRHNIKSETALQLQKLRKKLEQLL